MWARGQDSSATAQPGGGRPHPLPPQRPRPVPDTKMSLAKEGVGRVSPQQGTTRQAEFRQDSRRKAEDFPGHLRGSRRLLGSPGRSRPSRPHLCRGQMSQIPHRWPQSQSDLSRLACESQV